MCESVSVCVCVCKGGCEWVSQSAYMCVYMCESIFACECEYMRAF